MAKQPNILFLFADDQRFDTIHALGNHEIVTPTLDRLVDKGVTFSNAYIMGGSCLAVCMPSRAMLMTGRTLFHIEGRGETIPPAHSMLPEMFRRAGYTTFGTGKWHNGTASYARAFSAGAEIFFGGMDDHWNVPVCDFRSDGRYPEPVRRTSICGGREMTWRRQYHHYRKGRHSTDLFADATAAFLQSYDAATPFFAYVAFMAPHDPRETHPRYHAMYDPQQIRLPDNFMTEHPFDNGEIDGRDELLAARPRQPEEIRRHIAEYYAMISHIDAAVGRILDALRASGHADNTIVLFSGDNGLALGRHGLMGKQNLYDHSLHVPLIMAGPGLRQGDTCRAGCYLSDIFPTLCEMAGLAVPDSVEGRSLLPALEGASKRVHDAMLFAYRDVQRGIQKGVHKLIEYCVNGKRTTQLFDVTSDPLEMANLTERHEHAAHLAQLRTGLQAWRELGDDSPFWSYYTT